MIVDECHHVPAVTFERFVRQIPVRQWLGLTATPYRRDHLESLISMYCGSERHRMTTDELDDARIQRVLTAHATAHDPVAPRTQASRRSSGPLSRTTTDPDRSAMTSLPQLRPVATVWC